MKKSWVALFVVLSVFFAVSVHGAYADVVEEPPPYNAFYEEHMDECEELYETYIINDPVMVYWSPGGDDVLMTLDSGDYCTVTCTYVLDGEKWGLVETEVHAVPDEDGEPLFYYERLSGWVRMEELESPKAEKDNTDVEIIGPVKDRATLGQVILICAMVAMVAVAGILLVRAFSRSNGDKKQ